MAKFVLDEEIQYDFLLIGISSHVRDYRICWALNKCLDLGLEKVEDDILIRRNKEGNLSRFSVYYSWDEESEVEFELISNRSENAFLIPERRTADYFLKISEWYDGSIEDLLVTLRNENLVNMAFEIDIESLRSKENLLNR